MSRTHHPDFFRCNNCGEEVAYTAKVCPHCGADDETAWKDGINSYSVAEDDFDYAEVVNREVNGGTSAKGGCKSWVAVLAAILLALMLWRMLG